MLHGLERYRVKGEKEVFGALFPEDVIERLFAKHFNGQERRAVDPIAPARERAMAPTHTFCRLFPRGPQQDPEALIALGMSMETEVGSGDPKGNSSIPAGLTYFGQFLDHDITLDETKLSSSGAVVPGTIENGRTPDLDLDSVYGGGPSARPELYEADGVLLRVGVATESPDSRDRLGQQIPDLPNDLPREADASAIIGDHRNDENLAVAQIHLAFIKYHNHIAGQLRDENPNLPSARLFERARSQVVKHYQSIVLTEFLPRVIDPNALESVLSSGRKFYRKVDRDCMPVEFSVAAYRFGHSMVRPSYNWNRVFNDGPVALAPGSLQLLFEFSGLSGSGDGTGPFFDQPVLPSNWVADWRLLFDIPGHPPVGFSRNVARKIDTNMAFALKMLPEFAQPRDTPPELMSLASRNLLRGRLLRVPSGQAVAHAMADAGLHMPVLSARSIENGSHGELLSRFGFTEETPLWFYILREAEEQNGERLGPIGSCILAETLVGLIENSKTSLLDDKNIDSLDEVPKFSMARIFEAIGEFNPIGD